MSYARAIAKSQKIDNLSPPRWVWLAPAALLPLAALGPNSVLVLYSILVLALGIRLLWRPGEPPILLFIFFSQWMQSAAGALYANALGTSLAHMTDADRTFTRGAHDLASALMLTGVLILAFAMKLAAGKPSLERSARIKTIVASRPFGFWLRIYAVTWLFAAICAAVAPLAGGLKIPFLTLSGVKWAGFVLLTFAAFGGLSSSARTIWGLIFGFEFLLSIGGYFASFKEVFLFTLIAVAAVNVRFRPRLLITGAALCLVMVGLGIVWTAVKEDYRTFANAGTNQQVIAVDYGEGLAKISDLVYNLDGGDLSKATEQLFLRSMYHEFFGVVINRVPSTLPHTGGEIWGEAITRTFTPRIIFPEKRSINDSDLTNIYTGLGVANADQGTSISLGYMAEAYIDFGPILMFAAIGALGAGIGFFNRWLLRRRGPMAVFGLALAPFALMPAHLAETSILKMVPALILTLLACFVVLKWFAPMLIRGRPRPPSRLATR